MPHLFESSYWVPSKIGCLGFDHGLIKDCKWIRTIIYSRRIAYAICYASISISDVSTITEQVMR